MISVRIPSSLVDELRDVSQKDHFMDLSEAVRSIIRKRWMSAKDPLSVRIDHLREEIIGNISKSSQETLVRELERIRTAWWRVKMRNKPPKG
jgi:Arc/MetJ-type ribon-helix-helix transcriptional regulator